MKTLDPEIVGKTIASVSSDWEDKGGIRVLIDRITFTDGTFATLSNQEWMPGEWAVMLKMEKKD